VLDWTRDTGAGLDQGHWCWTGLGVAGVISAGLDWGHQYCAGLGTLVLDWTRDTSAGLE